MGGVRGTVTQSPKSSAKNSALQVDVSGLVVSVKMADVVWIAEDERAADKKPAETSRKPKHVRDDMMTTVSAQGSMA
jgi:hypothetical protein